MIDALVVVVLVALIVRGWMRGLLREAIDVGALVLAAITAFRSAPAVGRSLTDLFGVTPGLARVLGGALLFIAILVAASIVGALIHRSIKVLPGLTTLNRLGGAALGMVYTVVLVVIALTLMAAAPLPAAVGDQVDRSGVAAFVAEPTSLAQQAFGVVSGDRALQSMAWIRATVDDWVVDPAVTKITLPTIDDDARAHVSVQTADDLFERINRTRAEGGHGPLEWSESLSLVATARALSVYQTGSFVASRSIEERLTAAGVEFDEADESIVLAATGEGLAGVLETPNRFTDIGVGVVDGPYGLIAVVVSTE